MEQIVTNISGHSKSSEIGELAYALSQLQGEIKDPVKDQAAHKHRYATIDQVLDILRPALKKNELSIVQLPSAYNDKVTLETILMHKSGQWISSTLEMKTIDQSGANAAQNVGIIITYARRYALSAMMGLAQVDEDGNTEAATRNNRALPAQIDQLFKACNNSKERMDKIMQYYGVNNIAEMTSHQCAEAINKVKQSNNKTPN